LVWGADQFYGKRKEDTNMAVNLEAIRKRVQELNGQRRNSSVQLWKPEIGEYKVRCVPWKSTPDGMPFLERRFYYLGENPRILAPSQFGKPDPVNDLIRKLYSSGKPDDRELAKKLQPKMTAYIPIIVRGQEDKGTQVWSFNKFIYQRLLDFFTNSEINPDLVDYIDPLEGVDLIVTIKKSGKKYNGRDVMDTVIDLGRKQTKLSPDAELAKKWLDGVPNLDDMYQQKSVAEIEQVLNTWLSGGASGSADEGTARGAGAPKDALEQLVEDVKTEVKAPAAKAEEPKAAAKKASAKKADADLDDAAPAAKQTLDDAFDELMDDDTAT
jgi:hypothetical protein